MKYNYSYFLPSVVLASLCFQSNAQTSEQTSQSELPSTQVLEQGKNQYLKHCAGCHKKDLSGSVGFNLKDGEWVHGGKPQQILRSLQQGFDKAGMPGFGNILAKSDQQAIVAYILSQRQGFENLVYKIYQLDSDQDFELSEDDIIKSGALKNNVVDFELPEIPHYAIRFSGVFHAPKNEKSFLFSERVKDLKIEVKVDGKPIKPITYGGVAKWLLKPGQQALTFTFNSSKASPYLRNIPLYVVNEDSTIKLFPVSTLALAASKNTKYEVKTAGEYLVQQKKIIKLPAYSIAVGAPEKINYAFNAKTCAINGMWQGDLLNVGPNIGGRGKDGSIPLGDWIFHFPQQLKPSASVKSEANSEASCQLDKYRINDNTPEFYFTLNQVKLMVTSDFSVPGRANFIYRVLANPNKHTELAFSLPQSSSLAINSAQGKIQKDSLVFDIKAYSNFSIQMAWTGDNQ
ncbi:c-type cytochrome [Paraglaciecola aquimarina]|uniref:C-type cytochrome n=1 Tax=Paraglaciecola algarum TaxID=3050085 RepID=A0ABS9DCP3_9ALTE|nr:c-type cytochrome [Paraglaciecola sp. G1-23]MCF2949406.1 c-type cytochrome [Paraglaciecola sp. G1-23]